MAASILLLSDDLLDASRIAGHGRAFGFEVTQCRNSQKLIELLSTRPTCVVLDLHNPGLDLDSTISQIKAANAFVVGFGSHVNVDRLKAARQAGCQEVLPRSSFFEDLDANLARWVNQPS